VRLGEDPSALLECLHLEAFGDCVSLRDSLVTLGGCCHLDVLEQWGSSCRGYWLSLAPIMVIVRGSWPFPGGEPKSTLVDCSWLVWSSSCVGCAAPYRGFGVWCQLVCEPPSEWITTTRTSLLASKWTSVKNLVSSCSEDFIGIHRIWLIGFDLWMAHNSTHRYNHRHPLLYYIPSVQAKLFSVISFES
jgi:hypothetical protein